MTLTLGVLYGSNVGTKVRRPIVGIFNSIYNFGHCNGLKFIPINGCTSRRLPFQVSQFGFEMQKLKETKVKVPIFLNCSYKPSRSC